MLAIFGRLRLVWGPPEFRGTCRTSHDGGGWNSPSLAHPSLPCRFTGCSLRQEHVEPLCRALSKCDNLYQLE